MRKIFILKYLHNFDDFINKLQISHPINILIKGNFLFNLMNDIMLQVLEREKNIANHDLIFLNDIPATLLNHATNSYILEILYINSIC